MGEAPGEVEDCPSAEVCQNGCDQHPQAEKDAVAKELERRRLASIPAVVLARLAESDDPAVELHLRRHGITPPEGMGD